MSGLSTSGHSTSNHPTMDLSTHYCISSDKIIHETIDGEVIVVNLDNGNYYSLVGCATEIWQALLDGVPLRGITHALQTRYDADAPTIQQSLSSFVNSLCQEQLIAVDSNENANQLRPDSDNSTDSALPQDSTDSRETDEKREKFEPPTLSTFSDLQDLLLLDPIHDVDEMGWPHIKEN